MPIAFDVNMDANWAIMDDAYIVNTLQSKTWNDPTRTFRALAMNITDTTSASASLLMDLQVASSSKFKVDKAGVIYKGGVQLAGPSFCFADDQSPYSITAGGTTLYGWALNNFGATEAQSAVPMPFACTVAKLYVRMAANSTNSTVVTVRKNSANTAVTTTLVADTLTGSDTSNSVAFAAGDRFTVSWARSNGGSATLISACVSLTCG